MLFESIYRLGKKYAFVPPVDSLDRRFSLIQFPFDSQAVLSGALMIFTPFFLVGLVLLAILPTAFSIVAWVTIFYALVFATAALAYPITIHYAERMIDYKEEMLYSLLEVSNYVSLDASLEHAIIQTNNNISGVLRDQFGIILERLERKKYRSLTEGLEAFIPVWLSVNVDFVKGLSLLQTASMAKPEDRRAIIDEVIDTVILGYYQEGKRFAEELSSQTESLIAFGVVFPVMLLIMLPMASIFMPNLISVPLLVFAFNILLPTVLLLVAMNFSSRRVQVHTIKLDRAPSYESIPGYFYLGPILLAVVFLVPTILHFTSFGPGVSIEREYAIESVLTIWIGTLGIALAIGAVAYIYVKKNEALWKEIYDVEEDLPHLLQVFTTYLSLNRSAESVMVDVIDDYKRHGLSNHPVTRVFESLNEQLGRTKKTLLELVRLTFPRMVPSARVTGVFEKIIGFTEVSQESAAQSARMIRSQTLNVFKLDDYLRTLLANTLSMVYTAVTLLVPLLSAAAVIMSMAIVMALTYIQDQLKGIVEAFGTKIDLSLVQMDKIIPPTILEFIIGIYFLEMVLILSVFDSNIRYGNDKFKVAQSILQNLTSAFTVYSLVLLGGYFFFREVVFKVFLGA